MLDPVKLVIDNYPGGASEDRAKRPTIRRSRSWASAQLPFSRELWIEREDFMEVPSKGYFRLFPGNQVRLRYGYRGEVHRLRQGCRRQRHGGALRIPSRLQIRHAGRGHLQGQGQHPLGHRARTPTQAEVRLYDRLFNVPHPGSRKGRDAVKQSLAAAEHRADVDAEDVDRAEEPEIREDYDFRDDLNPDSTRIITAYLEPGLSAAKPDDCFQFERHGYFVADRVNSAPGRPVFNRAVTLRDSWGKQG